MKQFSQYLQLDLVDWEVAITALGSLSPLVKAYFGVTELDHRRAEMGGLSWLAASYVCAQLGGRLPTWRELEQEKVVGKRLPKAAWQRSYGDTNSLHMHHLEWCLDAYLEGDVVQPGHYRSVLELPVGASPWAKTYARFAPEDGSLAEPIGLACDMSYPTAIFRVASGSAELNVGVYEFLATVDLTMPSSELKAEICRLLTEAPSKSLTA